MEREHLELLMSVAGAFPGRQIVTIGAAAFRWHYASFRGTLDLDLCIAVNLEEYGRSNVFPRSWTRVQGMPHRWRLPDGQLLVCGERHEARIRQFLTIVGDPTRREHVWMLDAGPASWVGDETALPLRLQALLDGLGSELS